MNVELPDAVIDLIADAVAAKLALRFEQPEPSPYLTTDEAADYLRCSRQRIHDLLSAGRLTRVKEGRRTLVRRDEIDGYLDGGS